MRGLTLFPIHPIFILMSLPFLPQWLYLNRGYTFWYHLITISYLLTRREWLRRFLIIQGTGVTLGWYAAMANDIYNNGRFAHILYMNMPTFMKTAMVDADGHVFYSYNSVFYMCISHILDTLLHPGIAYLLYKAHIRSGKNRKPITSWSVLIATFAVSRLWSLVHTHHNGMDIGAWYFGYDVYHIHDLDCWMPAYLTEGLFFASICVWKLSKTFGVHVKGIDSVQHHESAKQKTV